MASEPRRIHSDDRSLATGGDSRSFWAAQEGRRGGTGRRAGLKIQYSQGCVGSIPSAGISLFALFYTALRSEFGGFGAGSYLMW
jgi:hypothetical protein